MSKQDFIDLIKVAEGILRIEEGCKIISGCDMGEGDGSEIYLVWDILRRNSAKRFCATENLEKDDDNYQNFVSILESKELSAEEKFERLIEKSA